jgi:hypothetical protein
MAAGRMVQGPEGIAALSGSPEPLRLASSPWLYRLTCVSLRPGRAVRGEGNLAVGTIS